jgi:ABC-2 type transport system ATP-binding protein
MKRKEAHSYGVLLDTSAAPPTPLVGPGPAIRATGLVKDYDGLRAVDHLTFEVPAGVVAGFVGPNGAGKTTTIRMLVGLVTPTGGSAEVLGVPVSEAATYLPRVGTLIEGPAFYPTLSGRRNLEVLATLGSCARERVEQALATVELTDRADDRYDTYSLGMKQRLGIAAALLCEPELLILDEPVNGLDPAGILDVRRLLRRLAASGVTVFVSSHLLTEVEQIADWLVILEQGRLIFVGPISEAIASQRGGLIAAGEPGADLGVVVRVAAESGYEATLGEDGRIRIEAPSEFAGQLNREAMRAGVTLTELYFRRPTLEDVFFAVTEGGAA